MPSAPKKNQKKIRKKIFSGTRSEWYPEGESKTREREKSEREREEREREKRERACNYASQERKGENPSKLEHIFQMKNEKQGKRHGSDLLHICYLNPHSACPASGDIICKVCIMRVYV